MRAPVPGFGARRDRRAGPRDVVLGPDAPWDAQVPEHSDERPADGLSAVLFGKAAQGHAVELAWLGAHVAMYPWGLLRDRRPEQPRHLSLEGMGPKQRSLIANDIEAAGTPIILLHGVVDNRTVFTYMRRSLRLRGFDRIVTINYSPLSDDIRAVAKRLADVVEAVVHETGYERVHIVGHSLGGLIGRYYVQRMGGDARVHTLVTLGSPHSGSRPASWVPHPLARQLRPDSDIVREFEEPAPGCTTRFIAFWSDIDLVVSPRRSARMQHRDLNIRNVIVPGVGHNCLPIDGRVVHEICTALAHLDFDGRDSAPTQPRGQQPHIR